MVVCRRKELFWQVHVRKDSRGLLQVRKNHSEHRPVDVWCAETITVISDMPLWLVLGFSVQLFDAQTRVHVKWAALLSFSPYYVARVDNCERLDLAGR